MDAEFQRCGANILVVPFPTQGHVNPLIQFCKRLAFEGATTTLAITNFIAKTMKPKSDTISIATISDGCDDGGFAEADSIPDYITRMETAGSKSLEELIRAMSDSKSSIDCVVYDAVLPWALDVAKKCGVKGACFFTQSCGVNCIYYLVNRRHLKLPATTPLEIQGLPLLELQDLPSFLFVQGSYLAYFELVLNQFSTVEKADFVLVNSFYKLEEKVVDKMQEICPMLTIGPTIPSSYLDRRVADDLEYGLNLVQSNPSISLDWLSTKPKCSVIYIAFGSKPNLQKLQIQEIALALKASNFPFLWVMKPSDQESLPKHFITDIHNNGLFVDWSPQLRVLANEAVGCFFSHGGWNSTLEALSLGMPMVVMPQWTDQTTNAKLVADAWQVGVRARVDDNGVAGRDEIERCLREVMEGEKGRQMRRNAFEYRDLAIEAVSEGGTSDTNIHKFLYEIVNKN